MDYRISYAMEKLIMLQEWFESFRLVFLVFPDFQIFITTNFVFVVLSLSLCSHFVSLCACFASLCVCVSFCVHFASFCGFVSLCNIFCWKVNQMSTVTS